MAGDQAGAADTDSFDYELPPERIAQQPIEPRDRARLLVDRGSIDRPGIAVEHRRVDELAQLVGPGDVVVVNDSRVLRARLPLRKRTGGRAEVLLLAPRGDRWEALVKGGRRIEPGAELLHEGEVVVRVGPEVGSEGGVRLVELVDHGVVDRVGQVPLPPYIHRELDDPERYQTVYANHPGSVAAPTAGLHLTPELLARMARAGAEIVPIELQVGLGTFRPITAGRVADHRMHGERYRIEADRWDRIVGADRVVAIGTTVVRALESAAATGELEATTELFIRRGFEWRVVDTLLTNFHVPRSSLLVMVDAFIGARWRDLYRVALDAGYRFLSFGDAMLIDRRHPGSP